MEHQKKKRRRNLRDPKVLIADVHEFVAEAEDAGTRMCSVLAGTCLQQLVDAKLEGKPVNSDVLMSHARGFMRLRLEYAKAHVDRKLEEALQRDDERERAMGDAAVKLVAS